MPLVRPFEFTVAELAERLALCTGDAPAFHARQIRHWAASGVMDAIGATMMRGDGRTAARVFSTTHLFGARILHHFAAQRGDVEFLTAVALLFQNVKRPDGDPRFWKSDYEPVASTGLATAIHFARQIALGGDPNEWLIYYTLHLTSDGTCQGGTFSVEPFTRSAFSYHWVEQRIVNVSAMLPCLFRTRDGQLADIASAEFLHNGAAYDPTPIEETSDDVE
jgi:hypothetical protein